MTVTNGYLTTSEAVDYAGRNTALDHAAFDDVITACSRMVDRFCGRHFYQVTATTRTFDAVTASHVEFGPYNDLVSVTALTGDSDGDGVFETTFSVSQYQLVPVGASERAPLPSPYTGVDLLAGATFPTVVPSGRRGLVRVTGTWGWPTAVPVEVKQATRILVAEVAKLQDAPFGVVGNDVVGVQYAPRQMPAAARRLLGPYIHPAHVGIG